MSRLHPIPCGTGLLLLPDFSDLVHDERVVKPARRTKGSRCARV
jgi:hypothetical protein